MKTIFTSNEDNICKVFILGRFKKIDINEVNTKNEKVERMKRSKE